MHVEGGTVEQSMFSMAHAQIAQADSGCRVGCRAALDRAEVVRIVRIKREKCSESHNNHQAVFGMPLRKRSRPTPNSRRRACTMPTSKSAGFMRASTCSLRHSPSWDQLQKCSQLFL